MTCVATVRPVFTRDRPALLEAWQEGVINSAKTMVAPKGLSKKFARSQRIPLFYNHCSGICLKTSRNCLFPNYSRLLGQKCSEYIREAYRRLGGSYAQQPPTGRPLRETIRGALAPGSPERPKDVQTDGRRAIYKFLRSFFCACHYTAKQSAFFHARAKRLSNRLPERGDSPPRIPPIHILRRGLCLPLPLCVVPGPAGVHVHRQGNRHLTGSLHLIGENPANGFGLFLGSLDDQLVVHLQNQAGTQPLSP